MNKVTIDIVKEEKVDNRVNNTGRPVNKKSSRQIRLRKQKLYNKLHSQFMFGVKFKLNNDGIGEYVYECDDKVNTHGYIRNAIGGHVCNVSYVGRTKVEGWTYVLDKRVNVTINLKEVTFIK